MMDWLSVHVFYNDDQDGLITGCIGPLIATSKRSTAISEAFFLRHWERGPHVRLRLLGQAPSLEENRAHLKSCIGAYLRANPSRGLIPTPELQKINLRLGGLEPGSDGTAELFPDNSVQFIPYKPEYAKYGGRLGVRAAERFFDRSTEVSLMALERCKGNTRKRLGVALSFVLMGVLAFRVPEDDVLGFLDRYARRWVAYVSGPLVAAQERWDESYRRQRPALAKIARSILGSEFESDPVLSAWWEAVEEVYATVRTLDAEDKLALGDFRRYDRCPEPSARYFLLSNYLHTTNNRLGVRPWEESYIAHLCARTIGDTVAYPAEWGAS